MLNHLKKTIRNAHCCITPEGYHRNSVILADTHERKPSVMPVDDRKSKPQPKQNPGDHGDLLTETLIFRADASELLLTKIHYRNFLCPEETRLVPSDTDPPLMKTSCSNILSNKPIFCGLLALTFFTQAGSTVGKAPPQDAAFIEMHASCHFEDQKLERCKQFVFVAEQQYFTPQFTRENPGGVQLAHTRYVAICLDFEGKAAPPPGDICPIRENSNAQAWFVDVWRDGEQRQSSKASCSPDVAYEMMQDAARTQFDILQGYLFLNPGKNPGTTVGEALAKLIDVLPLQKLARVGKDSVTGPITEAVTKHILKPEATKALKYMLDFGRCKLAPKETFWDHLSGKEQDRPADCSPEIWKDVAMCLAQGRKMPPGVATPR